MNDTWLPNNFQDKSIQCAMWGMNQRGQASSSLFCKNEQKDEQEKFPKLDMLNVNMTYWLH